MMKLKLDKGDLSWLHKNGFVSLEQVGVLWEQLSQRCDPITEGTTSWNSNASKKVDIPVVQGQNLGINKNNDICIAYSLANGGNLARSLCKRITRRKKKVCLAFGSSEGFDPVQAEKIIASSSSLVVLLTEQCLAQVEVVFALLVAKFYYEHSSLVILVHDAESCFFPGYDEQPDSVKDFFSEKAITFLNCYPEIGVTEIVNKFDEEMKALANIQENYRQKPTDALYQILVKHENRKYLPVAEIRQRMAAFMPADQLEEFLTSTDKNNDGTLDPEELREAVLTLKEKAAVKEDHHDTANEDLTTRLFLSHKRSTGQGIAGRLYEGLKGDYTIFIDSEAKFKIHNLKLIVEHTDVFVFILSYGILLSKWCLEELKSAVANNKRVIIVRELSYKLPAVLPDEWLSVEPVLRNSIELIWLAEYNTACVNALKVFIGSPDKAYRAAERHIQTKEGKELLDSILSKFQTEKILDLNHDIPLPSGISPDGILDIVLRSVPQQEIKALHIKAPDSLQQAIFLKLPFLQELKTSFDNESIIKEALMLYPSLKKLTLQFSKMGSLASNIADAEELEYLDIGYMRDVDDSTVEVLAAGSPALETLKLTFSKISAESFKTLPKFAKLKQVRIPSVFNFQNVEERKSYMERNPLVKLDMEPVFTDIDTGYGSWLPGVVQEWAEFPTVHPYCDGYSIQLYHGSPSKLAPFKSHQDNYATQNRVHDWNCPVCNLIDPFLEHTTFGGKRNIKFIKNWFFDDDWGKDNLPQWLATAKQGYLSTPLFRIPQIGDLEPEIIAKKLFESVDPNTITTLYWNYVIPGAEYWLKHLPKLKKFFTREWTHFPAVLNGIVDALPVTLEELRLNSFGDNEVAQRLADKIQKLDNFQSLHLCNVEPDCLSTLFQAPNKLRALTLRSCPLTKDLLLQIAQTSKEVVTLDLTNCSLLKSNCLPILIKEFPELKHLKLDPSFVHWTEFQGFKSARPNVTVEERSYLLDVFDDSKKQWFPAIQLYEDGFPGGEATFHLHGADKCTISGKEIPDRTAPFMSHAHEYGQQYSGCYNSTCIPCSSLVTYCKDTLLGGQPNEFTYAERFLETAEGKELLATYAPQGPENRINFEDLPKRINPKHIVQALSNQYPDKQFTIRFTELPYPATANSASKAQMEEMIEARLPIHGLEFLKIGNFSVPSMIADCLPNLKRFMLVSCGAYPESPVWDIIASLKQLEYLDIRESVISDASIRNLANCTKLTHLELALTSASDHAVEFLCQHLVNLKFLNLRATKISSKLIESLAKSCPAIQYLDIGACALDPNIWKYLAEGFPDLKEVKLPFFFGDTAELKSLKSARPGLTVDTNEVVDHVRDEIRSFGFILIELENEVYMHRYGEYSNRGSWQTKSLEPFSKTSYSPVSEDHLHQPCQFCDQLHPYCKDIKFGDGKNPKFINDWFADPDNSCAQLKYCCDRVTSTGELTSRVWLPAGLTIQVMLKAVAQKIPDAIRVFSTSTLLVEDFDFILSRIPNLQSLYMHGQFTDEHAKCVAERTPHITSLSLFHCDITDNGMKMMATKLQAIQILNIRHCRNITDEGIETLLQSNQNMTQVELDFQHQLTEKSVLSVGQLPHLYAFFPIYWDRQQSIRDAIPQLQASRPTVQCVRSPLFVDCSIENKWFIGLMEEENEERKECKLRIVGRGDVAWVKESDITEAFRHTTEYASFGSPYNFGGLWIVARNFLFGGKPFFQRSDYYPQS